MAQNVLALPGLLADPSTGYLQRVFAFNHTQHYSDKSPIWDPIQARFSARGLPYVSLVPLIWAFVAILSHAASPLVRKYRPKWWQVFIPEYPTEVGDGDENQNEPWLRQHIARGKRATWIIAACSAVAAGTEGTRFIYTGRDEVEDICGALRSSSWVISFLYTLASQPRTFSPILLVLHFLNICSVLCVVSSLPNAFPITSSTAILLFTLLPAIGALVVLLRMPLRNPRLSREGIAPSFSAPTSKLRSPEDDLTAWQFMSVSWMSPLVNLGRSRKLDSEDVWTLAREFQHERLHTAFRELKGSVVKRLLRANAIDLVITSTLGMVELIANSLSPVLLQLLLQSMQAEGATRRAQLTYAAISLMLRLVANQAGVFNLWYCRRCYERSRGEMITMLFEKTLKRKMTSMPKKSDEGEDEERDRDSDVEGQTNGSSSISAKERGSLTQRAFNALKSLLADLFCLGKRKKEHERLLKEAKKAASMGKILNLMKNDAYEVSQRFWEFPDLLKQPIGLVLSIVLIWKFIGTSCLIGAVSILIGQVITVFLARSLIRWEEVRRSSTDGKLQVITQFIESIRHLRWYAWESSWLASILEKRQEELRLRVICSALNMCITVTGYIANIIFPIVAFASYTILEGRPLTVDVAFPALQLFAMLEMYLTELPRLITVLLNAQVAVNRIEHFMKEPDKAEQSAHESSEIRLEARDASFAWPGTEQDVLRNISLTFPQGITLVQGKVGAGKSALLLSLLGELDMTGGHLARSPEPVGYCEQSPWLQSMSIRENILFHTPYDEVRYKQVLEACALTPDLAGFKHGDLSNIGENGIGLSGGQKARVALARAVYNGARILMLDDPLSALDHHTAEFIVNKCFAGPLMEGRTVILVTHRTELCRPFAKQVVEISNSTAHTLDENELVETASETSKEPDKPQVPMSEEIDQAVPEKFIDDEHRAHGGVKASVYWEYIKAGSLKWWTYSTLASAIFRFFNTIEKWLLKEWGEAYGDREPSRIPNPVDRFPSPAENIDPWLLTYIVLAVCQTVIVVSFYSMMIKITYNAGRRMFSSIMNRVANATFRFYDTTPVGRLMNRMTSDISIIDGNIYFQINFIAFLVILWTGSLVVIAMVTPVFLLFSILLVLSFIYIFVQFLPCSQSLRRLEMVSLSPLLSNFGALADGLMTIRAFAAQTQFQDRVIEVTDTFQGMDHFYWCLQEWLMFRSDFLSAMSTFLITVLALYTNVSAGLTAFVLIFAAQFVDATHNLCRQYGNLQMDFVSVERVVELTQLDQEKPGDIDPPAAWPSLRGRDDAVRFDNVTVRYAEHLDPALRGVSFALKPGSTTAIVGRTGSGKSTAALALLATVLPEQGGDDNGGSIYIDGLDVSRVNRRKLRSRVTFLAQDPVLFPGTMRRNLDPLDEFEDAECKAVLEKMASRHGWELDTQVDSGGKNLSQGQRQLVGLARAILRRSAIVILDEATASIDMETAMEIQQTLRNEMKESTVITIAHRVEAVKDADYYVALAEGKVVDQGPVKANSVPVGSTEE